MRWRKRLVPVLAAASLLVASGPLASGVSHAEEAVLIPGATVFALDFDRAIADGVVQATAAVRQNSGPVVVIGESMGSMVAWRVATELAEGSDASAREDVRVVLIAPPEVGVAEYFRQGTHIPLLDYRVTRIARSPYDTTVVIGEYDGWADPPDRPWNLLASANALAGVFVIHGPPIFTTDVSGLTPVDYVAGDSQYGSVTTYLVPTPHLPLTQVFRDIGVRDEIVDRADQVLRPLIDAAYVRHDQPGDTRPYLYDGAIRRTVPISPPARASAVPISPPARASAVPISPPARASAVTRELPQALRPAIRDDALTRAKAAASVRPPGALRSAQVSGHAPHRESASSRRQP